MIQYNVANPVTNHTSVHRVLLAKFAIESQHAFHGRLADIQKVRPHMSLSECRLPQNLMAHQSTFSYFPRFQMPCGYPHFWEAHVPYQVDA